MIMAQSRKPRPRKSFRRSEINGVRFRQAQEIWNRERVREIEHWLLRAGLSPQASRPMSEIGIYTDFT